MNNTKGTALVTGGAKRIGRHLSLELAGAGYNIALHFNKSSANANEVLSEINKCGVDCKLYKYDFSRDEEICQLINDVTQDFSDLNLIVNNASVFAPGVIMETGQKYFDTNFNVNFKAPFFLSRDFAKIVGKGNIINILDSRIDTNDPGYSIYTLSKKILAEFTKMSAIEFAPEIRVNAIVPGFILPPENVKDDFYKKRSEHIPMGRNGTVSDILNALNYILDNDYINGQFMYVDGGEHL